MRVVASLVALLAGCMLNACGGGGSAPVPPAPVQQVEIASLSLITAPRVALASDGTAWLVWAEGRFGDENLGAAAVEPSGHVSRSTLSAGAGLVQRDAQIVVPGARPLVAWRSLTNDGGLRIHVAARAADTWQTELQVEALAGDFQLIGVPGGSAVLLWFQAAGPGRSALMAARRSASGAWAGPDQVVDMAAEAGPGPLRAAAADDGSLMTLWLEARAAAGADAGGYRLNSARFDALAGRWEPPVPVAADRNVGGHPAIVALRSGGWLAAWIQGPPEGPGVLQVKPWQRGAWAAAGTPLDGGEGHSAREVHLAARGSGAQVFWTTVAADSSTGSIHSVRWDSADAPGSAPVRLFGGRSGQPVALRVATREGGATLAAWAVDPGDGRGPYWTRQDAAGAWQSPAVLDEGLNAALADVAARPTGDAVVAWYRYVPGGLQDVVVRRLPLP